MKWPVITYGCEEWTMKKDDTKRVEAAEIWFYRHLLRVHWTDKRNNESVLNELQNIQILNLLNKRRLSYIGHITRSKTTDLMSTTLMGKVEGKRNIGRPPTSFINNITNVSGLGLAELIHRGRERDEC